MSDNIVLFPGANKSHPPQTDEDIRTNVQNVRQRFAQETALSIGFKAFAMLEDYHVDLSSDDHKYDLVLLVETLKATILRSYELSHPLQEFAQQAVDFEETISDIEEIIDGDEGA